MKKLIILSIISLFTYSHTQIESCEYQEYHENISKALTEKYSNNNWIKANELFKSAFGKVKTPIGKDLEEALEVSLKLEDKLQTEFIIRKLLGGGIPIRYFDQYTSILKSNWWKKIQMDYPEIENRYKKEYDLELLNKLLFLREQDSLFNIEYHQFRKGEKDFELDYLVKKAKGIYNGFKALVNHHGFPSEINTGYLYRNNKIQALPTNVVLIHIHQNGEYLIKNDFTYKELICSGHLTAYNYEHLTNIISFGQGKGAEHEMKVLYETHKKKN